MNSRGALQARALTRDQTDERRLAAGAMARPRASTTARFGRIDQIHMAALWVRGRAAVGYTTFLRALGVNIHREAAYQAAC